MTQVRKRDGRLEPLDIRKFSAVAQWACEGIRGVSPSELELRTKIQFWDGITTSEIQETLIKSAADLISEESPNYQHVAGRLISYHLRKSVYGRYQPHRLHDHVRRVTDMGLYDPALLQSYSEEEFDEVESFVDHRRDEELTYAAMEQMRGKYLVRERVSGRIVETPQVALALLAMTAFVQYPADTRMACVRELYECVSTHLINLPTPIMAGLRTNLRQYSSCVLIDCGDSLDSISATTNAVLKYVAQRAGIGINVGRIRAIGSKIRDGDATSTGVIPYIKLFQSAVQSCSQGSVRKGSGTLHFPLWHYEVQDLIVLKNNKGTDDVRARHVDYSVQVNKTLYERLLQRGNISLFSPSEVPGLYDAFFRDNDEFKRLYELYEADIGIRRITVPAVELFSSLLTERKETGRVYVMNVDHVNDHGSFDKLAATIYMSNLCQEIGLPTVPMESSDDIYGEVSICTIAAINWGKVKKPQDFERPARILVKLLNAVLDYQGYPVRAAELSTRKRRPLGIGIVNFAYWMAKNGHRYQDATPECLAQVHEYMEAMSYYLIDESVRLTELYGVPTGFKDTKYSQGLLPIDTYKAEVDDLTPPVYRLDWDGLRQRAKFGMLNSTLMAQMPAETSAQFSNSTNGFEPVRALVSVKQSKDGVLKQVVPEFWKLRKKYDLLWDQKSPEGYLKIAAVIQKFMDQCMSINTSYNPRFYPEEKIPMSVMLRDMLNHYKWGGKTLYYQNTYDGAGEHEVKPEEEDCDACKV